MSHPLQTDTPLRDALIAATAAAEQAQARYDDCDQDQAASDADATEHGWDRMGDYLGAESMKADRVRDAAHQAWMDSDEPREYEEDGHVCSPSEVEDE